MIYRDGSLPEEIEEGGMSLCWKGEGTEGCPDSFLCVRHCEMSPCLLPSFPESKVDGSQRSYFIGWD